MIIAGTGHRPKFCPCKYKDPHPWLDQLRLDLSSALKQAKPDIVISGVALGWDMWLAQEAIKLGIAVHAYIPFKGQGENWPSASKAIYQKVIDACEEVKYCSEDYYKDCFLKRDRDMVYACTHVWSLLNPEARAGGTFYTVAFAKRKSKPVTNFWRN